MSDAEDLARKRIWEEAAKIWPEARQLVVICSHSPDEDGRAKLDMLAQGEDQPSEVLELLMWAAKAVVDDVTEPPT